VRAKKMAIETRLKTFDGETFRFRCDPENHASWWSFEDEESVRERWWNIRAGDVVLDCGAAFGSYALSALAKGASRVVAWTPEGHMPLFRASVEANEGWRTRVTAFDSGLWSERGWLEAKEGEALPVFYADYPAVWREAMPPNAFSVTTVDATLADLADVGQVHWLKLDVEGAELEVLKGAAGTLMKHKPRVICENHLFKDPELKLKCAAFMDALEVGYREIGTVQYHSVSHTLYVA
jgi:FkbM family methyltransferase